MDPETAKPARKKAYVMTDAHRAALVAGRKKAAEEKQQRKLKREAEAALKQKILSERIEAIEGAGSDPAQKGETSEFRQQIQEAIFLILINPRYDNVSLESRAAMVGCSRKTYQRLKTEELVAHALFYRRAKYAERLSAIDEAILRKAEAGDIDAAKIAYERIEGWRPRTTSPPEGAEDGDSEIFDAVGVHTRRDLAERLAADLKLRGRKRLPAGSAGDSQNELPESGVRDPGLGHGADVGS